MPTFVNALANTYASGSAFSIAYAPSVDNTLLLGIFLQDGSASVSQVYDNVGNDIFENPINAWQNLGTINLGTTRVEMWGCLQIVTAPTTIYVSLTKIQTTIGVNLLEYSGV